jgi:hypothetical protein
LETGKTASLPKLFTEPALNALAVGVILIGWKLTVDSIHCPDAVAVHRATPYAI